MKISCRLLTLTLHVESNNKNSFIMMFQLSEMKEALHFIRYCLRIKKVPQPVLAAAEVFYLTDVSVCDLLQVVLQSCCLFALIIYTPSNAQVCARQSLSATPIGRVIVSHAPVCVHLSI